MVRFTLRQCQYFLAASECGGISQAARALNVSQPAIAQALEKLEAHVGFALFERHHARGVTPTVQGRALLDQVRRLLAEAERTEQVAYGIAAHRAGEIRFGCFHTLAPFHLAPIVSSYRQAEPAITIIAVEMRQDELVESILAGSIDLAMTYDMGLEADRFEKAEIAALNPYVILPIGHALAARSSIPLSALAEEPMVMFEGPHSGDYFRGLLNANAISPPVALTSTSIETVRSAVGNGLGFSILVMRRPGDRTCDGKRVAAIPIEGQVAALAVVLIRPRRDTESPLIDAFARHCKSQLAAPR